MSYYNELESYPAQWLRNLIDVGHISPGYVDERDIRKVQPDDLSGYTQHHFFAGIGVWSYALRLAGWPDDRPVWTGSCPCQPFSSAGKRGGTDDPRHLWPEWFRLIRERRPPVIFGEQVASKDGLAWLDLVYSDLEGEGYAVAAVDIPAASAQAPHIRQRLYFVAHAESCKGRLSIQQRGSRKEGADFIGNGETGELGDSTIGGIGTQHGKSRQEKQSQEQIGRSDISCGMGNAKCNGDETHDLHQGQPDAIGRSALDPWSECEWIPCREPSGEIRYRPTEPGLFPLAHGAAERMGRLRAYGNAIVAPLAAEFIRAYMDLEL